jgi:hypothetical protein
MRTKKTDPAVEVEAVDMGADFLRQFEIAAGAQWIVEHGAAEEAPPAPGLVPAKQTPDRVFSDDAGQIRIQAGRDEWFSRKRPKPFVFGLQSQLMAYELAKVLDDRHPYSVLGLAAEDEGRGDIRRSAMSLSDRCQKFFDTMIRAYRAKRLKSVPTSWNQQADETRLVFKVACALEVILDELADELAELGDGSVIGMLRKERDTAKDEREARVAAADKGQDDGAEPARSLEDFVSEFVAEEREAGRKPRQIGLEKAWRAAERHGCRDELREVFNKRMKAAGEEVKRGRPTIRQQ